MEIPAVDVHCSVNNPDGIVAFASASAVNGHSVEDVYSAAITYRNS